MIQWQVFPFGLLDVSTLYDIVQLRAAVFYHEQKCFDVDLDGLDKQSFHVVGSDGERVIATARILPPGLYKPKKVSFGRVAVQKSFRGHGYGKAIMTLILEYLKDHFPGVDIEFSAQLYLKKFYEQVGFVAFDEIYDEGSIPHIRMKGVNSAAL